MTFYRPPALHEAVDAIGSIYRALKAWQFYPKGHPTRRSSIVKSYNSMLEMMDMHDLTLNCGRGGFTLPDGEVIKDTAKLSDSLSFELFIRRAKSITFLKDLRQEDLLALVRILAVPHDELRVSGGIDTLLEQQGVSTVWVNEFDLGIIRGRRQQREAKGIAPPTLDEIELLATSGDQTPEEPVSFSLEKITSPEEELLELIGNLVSERDDDRYLLLVRQAVVCADLLISRNKEREVTPLIELLAEQIADTSLSYILRENAESALEQLAISSSLIDSVLRQMTESEGISTAAATSLLSAAGIHSILPIVEAVGSVQSLSLRKTLNRVLIDLGDMAVPTLTPLLEDGCWYIVRNICAILGAIGNGIVVPHVITCLQHKDLRVCKEAVRSLARLGGEMAENALIAILKNGDSVLLPQVMASLAGMKSRKALVEFLTIVFTDDMFLKTVEIKCEALNAIAIVGDPVVAPKIAELLETRFILAPKRGTQLKIAATECLGKLCNQNVLSVLQRYASTDSELGRAALMAIESLHTRCQTK